MSIQEIQEFYLSEVRENRGNVGYLVLSDLGSDEGLLAGRLAGIRKGYIVPVGADKSFEGIRKKISDSVDVLGLKRLFYGHVEYKLGKPLYLGILGGNVSIPYVWFFDPGMEILDDRDGWWIYSDLRYADSNGDGFFDLAEGRMEGLEAASLHMAREFLPKNQSAVLIGEYRHPKFQDMKFFGGGMTQAFLVELALDSANVSTRRIVEERIQVLNATTEEEASAKLGELFAVFSLKSLSGIPGLAWSIADLLDDRMMYPILEYNWINWSGRYIGIIPVPVHLDVIDDNIGQKIDASGIVGYFGVGGKGWIIPRRDRFYAELVFGPYEFGDNFSNLTFSGFLYNDHDMSASSGITENVIREGGSVLASSGIVHDPYSIGTSTIFFGRLAYGKPLGEALLDSVNINMVENTFGSFFLSPLWAPSGDLWGAFTSGSVYIKDKVERILFSDPAVRPVEKGITPYKITYRTGPADSFKAESWIKSNYTLGEGRLEFWNADDYLMVRERPVIPVFVREFVLPESSVLNWVNVSGIYSLENVTPDFVYNDSYYTNYTAIILDCVNSLNLSGLLELNDSQEGLILECMESAARPNVSYSYPNSTFWWSSHSLLDNRTLVYVFVPALIYENENYGRVLESARIEVDYEALVEMNVFAHDFFAGVNGTVGVELMNMGPEATGKLWIFVEGDENFEFSDNVTMSGNSSLMREFSFAPGIGYYEVIAVFELENGSVGPRYAYFSVEEPPKLEVVSIPELVVDEGESGYFQVKLKNNGSFRLENVNISYEGPFDFDFGSSGFDMEPGGEMMVNGNVHAPEGQASGKYSGVLDFRPLNDRNVSINITVNVPARAVPEVDDNEWLVKIKPGRYSEKSFALGNSGNVPLEVGVSCEMVGISCSPVPGIVEVLPREEGYFSVNVSVPGGYPTDQYSGTIMLMGNGFSQPPKMEIPIKVSVPEVAYWSVQPADWACVLPDCEKVFAVANSPDSNTPVHGEISLEGLPFVSVQDEVVVVPGQEKGVPVSAGIPGEGILSGIYTGNISFECYGNSEPEEQKVGVTILAGGPEFTLQKKFFPEKIMLFWKQFVVPKTNHVEIYINNRGEIPIEKINVSDEIPDGWNGKKPVLAFVKRNRSTPVKEFSYSYANGYANFSFNLSGKPLSNGEGIVIHYLIYSQPESIPAGDIVTQISGEARSHENIYSRGVSSATLKVEYFDPPTWLRWLFILIYRLW